MFFFRLKVFFTVFCSIFVVQVPFAQQRKIDSLIVLLKKSKEDTNKVNLLDKLAEANRSNLDQLKKYSDDMMSLSQKLKHLKGEYGACGHYFTYYRNIGNFDKCIDYTNDRLKIAQKLQDTYLEAGAYNGFGVVYGSGLNRYDKAIVYYKKSLNIRLQHGHKRNIETVYNNIANAYNKMQKHLDSALYYIDKAIEISINNPSKISNLSVAYSTKGEIYATLKEWDKATSFLFESYRMKEVLNDYSSHSYVLNYLGGIYEEKGQLDSALICYKKSLDIFEKKKIKSDIAKTYAGLARLSEKRNNTSDALKYYKMTMEARGADEKSNADKMDRLGNEQKDAEVKLAKERAKQADKDKENANLIARLATVGGFILLGFLVWIFMQSRARQKINQKLEKTYQDVEEKSKELQMLNGSLNSTVEELNITIETVDQQKQLVQLANQRMHDSIKYGKKIQEAILPAEAEIMEGFKEFFAIYMPRDTVSGDFYWYHKLNESTQFIAVVDCTGHGVPGAFMSMIGYSLLNQIISETRITDVSEILHHLDMGIIQGLRQTNNHNADGMDVCLCKTEKKNENEFLVTYSGAKRPLFYAENQTIQLARPTRESIGGMTGVQKEFQSQEILLRKGDVLYLTTDGFTDNPNRLRKRFGEERFAKLLQAITSYALIDQKNLLLSAYQTHQETTAQRDDITIVGVRL